MQNWKAARVAGNKMWQHAEAEKSLNMTQVGPPVSRESCHDRGPSVSCLRLLRSCLVWDVFLFNIKREKGEGHLILHPLRALVEFKRWRSGSLSEFPQSGNSIIPLLRVFLHTKGSPSSLNHSSCELQREPPLY